MTYGYQHNPHNNVCLCVMRGIMSCPCTCYFCNETRQSTAPLTVGDPLVAPLTVGDPLVAPLTVGD